MFNKKYTIVMDSRNTEETFRKAAQIISKFGKIKVKNVKDWEWTVIELKTNVTRWQMLVGKLKRELNITPVKLDNMWFF